MSAVPNTIQSSGVVLMLALCATGVCMVVVAIREYQRGDSEFPSTMILGLFYVFVAAILIRVL